MTDTASPEATLAKIDADTKSNERNAKYNLGIGLGFLAVSAVTAAVFPPVGVAHFVTTVGYIMGMLKGWDIVENIGTARMLKKTRDEVTKGTASAEKTKTRFQTLKKVNRWGLAGTVVLVAAALLSPLVVPAAAASAVSTTIALCACAVITPLSLFRGAQTATGELVKFNESGNAAGESKPAAAPPAAAPSSALSSTPSPAAGFDKAANGNNPAAPAADAAKDAKPAPKTPAM